MPARTRENDAAKYAYPELYRMDQSPMKWEKNFRTLGILLGLIGIAMLPVAMLFGLALLGSGMECIWLASPDLI
jgi:hypothetical protein